MNQDTIRNLKRQYDQIPVPPEAKERILLGIQQAKEENEEEILTQKPQNVTPLRQTKKGLVRIMIKRTAATAAAAVAAVTILVNVSPSVAMAMGKLPIIGPIAQIVTFRTYESSEGGFEAEIKVPEIITEQGSETANKAIEEYADELIAQYEADLKASEGEGFQSVTSTWDVPFESEQLLSIRIYTELAMASTEQRIKIFNIDKTTGNIVTLSDLLKGDQEKLAAIGENIVAQMREQMAADDSKSYFLDTDFEDSNFKGLTGEEDFYFNQDGRLVISFDEYEVAPGYMGAVEFTIPLDVTGEF